MCDLVATQFRVWPHIESTSPVSWLRNCGIIPPPATNFERPIWPLDRTTPGNSRGSLYSVTRDCSA